MDAKIAILFNRKNDMGKWKQEATKLYSSFSVGVFVFVVKRHKSLWLLMLVIVLIVLMTIRPVRVQVVGAQLTGGYGAVRVAYALLIVHTGHCETSGKHNFKGFWNSDDSRVPMILLFLLPNHLLAYFIQHFLSSDKCICLFFRFDITEQ